MISRLTLPALAVALACGVPLASAQAPDQDPGGRSEASRAGAYVDDRDPGGVSEATAQPTDLGSDQDVDSEAPRAVRASPPLTSSLDDGRRGSVALRVAVVPYDGPLLDGRVAGAAPGAARVVAPYDGPLDNGRPAGAAPSLADAAPSTPETAAGKTGASETSLVLSGVRPNPAPGRAALTFAVETAVPTTVTVYDLTGRRVAVAYDGVPAAGVEQRVDLDLAGVAAGTYVVVLDTGRERASETFQVVR